MRKSVILAAAFMAALTWSTPAKADTIIFDTNGAAAGGAVRLTCSTGFRAIRW